ncbi:MAG: TROVE domain-containing protein [Enterococcus sp.]|nr:TROVE domain-containing protein [Enterococcus sp.]
MSNALKNINNHVTAPTAKALPTQVENNAGGYVFNVSDKAHLERFLIIGVDGGTYYVGEKKLTDQNVSFLKNLIAKDETLVRETMLSVARENRAVRVSPTIFTAAMLHTYGTDKVALRAALPDVLRTSTHLFEYAQYIKNLAGWGRSKRAAIKDWYEGKTDDQLAYQLVKYRQRNGWTHRDLLRLSHAQPSAALAQFALGKEIEGEAPAIIKGYLAISKAKSAKEALAILADYPSLPWETLPTELHSNVDIWKTLFRNGSLKGSAQLRNVSRLARLGAFTDLDFTADFVKELTDPAAIAKSRLHPVNYLNASMVYNRGSIDRSNIYAFSATFKKDWVTESLISSALDEAFYTSFGNVEPANKRTLLALDVSGSMGQAALGMDLTCAEVAAAMAMIVVRTEPKTLIRGFSDKLIDLNISKNDSLPTVLRKVHNQTFGRTDCSLPMEWAIKEGVNLDTFAVFTDNETYMGRRHPFEALKAYRKQTGINARLAVFGVSATDFTIANPSDPGMMDFVGFDSSAPKVFTDFSAGNI